MATQRNTDDERAVDEITGTIELSIDQYLTIQSLVWEAKDDARSCGNSDHAAEFRDLRDHLRDEFDFDVHMIGQHTIIETHARTNRGGIIAGVYECLDCNTVHADTENFRNTACNPAEGSE